jgi:hypothetical protein
MPSPGTSGSSSLLPRACPPSFRPRTLESHPNNLPMQPTTLVGREREVAEVSDLTGFHTLRKIALARLAVRTEDQSVAFLVMPKSFQRLGTLPKARRSRGRWYATLT